ncbi:MBL fold metallo-hydrolase [Nocardia sp. NBC_01388]|uniref:MBL fold metallo-hydrolase n=1 Tax=Nocardia sp. NBC_01388 TaxID=2903596 RepID=UPI00324F41BA
MVHDEMVFLRPDVRTEPLVNGFRAWAHLLAPHTYARNLVARHVPRMREVLHDAQARADASGAGDAREWLDAVIGQSPHLIELGAAITQLDTLMLSQTGGQDLEPLYAQVPEPLRGRVELVYNRYNQPGVRFLEAILYRGPYYDPGLQAVRLERVDPDEPDEGLAVPRMPKAGRMIRPARFDSGIWNLIGQARRAPVRASELADGLGVDVEELAPFLTTEPPHPHPLTTRARDGAVFLNHACVLFESPRSSVLIDPLVAYRRDGATDRMSFADLPDQITCLAITHAHLDHLDIETLLQIRHLVDRVVVPRTNAGDLLDPSLALVLSAIGFEDVVELDDYTTLSLPDGSITALPFLGEHSDLTVRGKAGYAVTLNNSTSVLVADSRCLEQRVYEVAREQLGPIDSLFIGMECEGSPMTMASGPYLPTGQYTEQMSQARRTKGSDAAGGMELVHALGPRQVYVYAMGLEPWLSYMFGVSDPTRSYSLAQTEAFITECAALGLPAELLRGSQTLDVRQR